MIHYPSDQKVSHRFHSKRSAIHRWHAGFGKMSDNEALRAYVTGRPGLLGITATPNLSHSWLSAGDKAFSINYGSIISNPAIEFRKVLDYIGLILKDFLVQAIITRNQFERLSVGKRFWEPARKSRRSDPNSHLRKGIVGDEKDLNW